MAQQAARAFRAKWAEITNDPEWASLPPKQQQDVARFFARTVVRPEVGSSSKEMKDFLAAFVLGGSAPRPLSAGAQAVRGVARDVRDIAKGAARTLTGDNPLSRLEDATMGRASRALVGGLLGRDIPSGQALTPPQLKAGPNERTLVTVPLPKIPFLNPTGADLPITTGDVGQMAADPANLIPGVAGLAAGGRLVPRVATNAAANAGLFGGIAGADALARGEGAGEALRQAVLSGGTAGVLSGASAALPKPAARQAPKPAAALPALPAPAPRHLPAPQAAGMLPPGEPTIYAGAAPNPLMDGPAATQQVTPRPAPPPPPIAGLLPESTAIPLPARVRPDGMTGQRGARPASSPQGALEQGRVDAARAESVTALEARIASLQKRRPTTDKGKANQQRLIREAQAQLEEIRGKVEAPATPGATSTADPIRLPASPSGNLALGRSAAARVLSGEADSVEAAMARIKTGAIDLEAGRPGNGPPTFAGGYGLSHIKAKRDWEHGNTGRGPTGDEAVDEVIQALARGEEGALYERNGQQRRIIADDKAMGVVGLHGAEGEGATAVTGRRLSQKERKAKKDPGAPAGVQRSDDPKAMEQGYARGAYAEVRPSEGAGSLPDNVAQPKPPENPPGGDEPTMFHGISPGALLKPLKAADALADKAAEAFNRSLVGRAITKGGHNVIDGIRTDWGQDNDAANKVRRLVVSGHGQPKGYADARLQAEQSARQMQGRVYAKAAELEGSLDEAGRQELYEIVNDANRTSGAAEDVRDLTEAISRHLFEGGALTEAQFEAWKRVYLPRLYAKYQKEAPALTRLARTASTALKGSKARGIRKEMTPETLERLNQPWKIVGRNADGRYELAANGRKILVAERNVGNFMGQWRQVGTGKNGRIAARRDWTPAEREAMGEVKDVVASLNELGRRSFHDYRSATLLKEIARNRDWAAPAGGDVPEGWVHLGNEKLASGASRWGKLADHYVHPAIAADLKQADLLYRNEAVKLAGDVMGLWKKNKTIWNPLTYHVNNVMLNVPALELSGGSVFDLGRAAGVLKERGDLWRQMQEAGAFGSPIHAEDFRSLSPEQQKGARELLASLGRVRFESPRQAMRALWDAGAKLEALSINAGQWGDDVFRAALVLRKLEQGIPMEDAARQARAAFYNGSLVTAPATETLARTAFPFIKAWAWGAHRYPLMVVENPGKALKLAAYLFAFQKAGEAMAGLSQEQADARDAAMPAYLRKPGAYLNTPFKDSKGQPLVLQTANWLPWTQYMPSQRGALPWMPEGLKPGGPLGLAFDLAANYDPFMERKLRTATEDDTARYVLRQLGPGFLTAAEKLGTAATGRTEYGGRSFDLPTAAVNAAGLKLSPFNAELAVEKKGRAMQAELNEIRGAIRRQGKLLAQGSITEAQYQRKTGELIQLFNRRAQEAGLDFEQALKTIGETP